MSKDVETNEIKISLDDQIYKILQKIGEGASNQIRNRALSLFKRSEYANGWTYKMTRGTSGELSCFVYNKSKPTLAHLLERSGARGRKRRGFYQGRPHIEPAVNYFKQEYYDDLKHLKIKGE